MSNFQLVTDDGICAQVDTLNDDIRRLTKDNKEAFAKRMQLEAEKNKLENLLTNNLVRRKDELVQALQEISVEDRQRQLDSSNIQLADIEKRLVKVNEDFKLQNEKVTSAMRKVSETCVDVAQVIGPQPRFKLQVLN